MFWLKFSIIRFYQKIFKKYPQIGDSFAIIAGDFLGYSIIYIESGRETYNFLMIPDNCIMKVPKKEFIRGLKLKYIEEIEQIPYFAFSLCYKEYQFIVPSLDRKPPFLNGG